MNATQKNRAVLEELLERWPGGYIPIIATTRRERYHLKRLEKTGFVKRATAPRIGGSFDLGGERCFVYTNKPLALPYGGVFRAMRDKLRSGEAKDVAPFEAAGGDYRLPEGFFREGLDYCDAGRQAWVWSIGRHRETGVVWASRSPSKYQNPAFECLWLR